MRPASVVTSSGQSPCRGPSACASQTWRRRSSPPAPGWKSTGTGTIESGATAGNGWSITSTAPGIASSPATTASTATTRAPPARRTTTPWAPATKCSTSFRKAHDSYSLNNKIRQVEAKEEVRGSSAVVAIASVGSGHCRRHVGLGAGQHPGALAGSEPRGDVSVVDLSRHRKAVVALRREIEAGVVAHGALVVRRGGETVRVAGVDVALGRRDDAVMVGVGDGERRLVTLDQPLLDAGHVRAELIEPFKLVEEDFQRQSA